MSIFSSLAAQPVAKGASTSCDGLSAHEDVAHIKFRALVGKYQI